MLFAVNGKFHVCCLVVLGAQWTTKLGFRMECGKCHILLLLGWTHYIVALKRFKALNITQASVRLKIVTNVECSL